MALEPAGAERQVNNGVERSSGETMQHFRPARHSITPADAGSTTRADDDQMVYKLAKDLREKVRSVSPDEFYWQESHYDHDSRQGRELLFLMANYEWVRATSEIIDITRSDAIETTIKIDVDLTQITHEAFRKRTGRRWLPIAMLPPETGQRHFEPDLFAAVTDAAGDPMPMLPAADLRHQMSAAMAEIIAKMAVSHLPSAVLGQAATSHGGHHGQGSAVETRDERLLLSAAVYRLLRYEPSRNTNARYRRVIDPPRIKKAKESLLPLLDYYVRLLEQRAQSAGAAPDETREPQFNPELARRAIKVLQALAESVIVVVLVDQTTAPSVLTVRVPTRKLEVSKATWFKPWTWPVRPCGRLGIDMLMPTADADRQIQVNLPAGVSLDQAPGTQDPHLDIAVDLPQPWQDLSISLEQVFASHRDASPVAVVNALVDLSQVKSAAALRTLRPYEVRDSSNQRSPATDHREVADNPHEALEELTAKLSWPDTADDAALTNLRERRQQFNEFRQRFAAGTLALFRNTLADSASAQTVMARADMIEDVSQRAIPRSSRFYVDVIVDDHDYFSTARSSAVMSLILMIGVLCFLFFWPVVNPKAAAPAPEVLAIVLTLFATVQADRIERPDRSTLRGRLFAFGNWLIAASMLPAITLAVALAFKTEGRTAEFWAEGCIGAQIAFLLLMWHGPLMSTGWPRMGKRRIITTDQPDYEHFEALRSNYWRITTADALMIGRKAHGYVLWQKADPNRAAAFISPELRPILTWDREPAIAPNESRNLLALLRAGTLSQAVTFVVFRGEPGARWPADADARKPLELDPGRLVPMDSATSAVDVFVGVSRGEMLTIKEHPLVTMLQAATNRVMVIDAQLPVPAPVAGHDEMHWARIRVALRDSEDIGRLTRFLGAVYKEMKEQENAGHLFAVQAVPAVPPRLISTAESAEAPWDGEESEAPILTSDLDVVNSGVAGSEKADAQTWHVLAICADARGNIESEILQELASVRPRFQLAGLTYALLHGTSVIFLLVHEPQADDPPGTPAGRVPQPEEDRAAALEADLCAIPTLSKVQVLLHEKLSRDQLGRVAHYPLLRIRFRWQDQPQAFLNLLDSLNKVLKEELKSIEQLGWSVSYARLQVPTGQVARGSLAVRLHIPAEAMGYWAPSRMEEIGRRIETAAALAAEKEQVAIFSASDSPKPDDPVINIDHIKKRLRREGILATVDSDRSAGSGNSDLPGSGSGPRAPHQAS